MELQFIKLGKSTTPHRSNLTPPTLIHLNVHPGTFVESSVELTAIHQTSSAHNDMKLGSWRARGISYWFESPLSLCCTLLSPSGVFLVSKSQTVKILQRRKKNLRLVRVRYRAFKGSVCATHATFQEQVTSKALFASAAVDRTSTCYRLMGEDVQCADFVLCAGVTMATLWWGLIDSSPFSPTLPSCGSLPSFPCVLHSQPRFNVAY